MSQKAPEVFTEGLKKLIQPYLGNREAGGLHIVGPNKTLPYSETPSRIEWLLGYQMIFRSSSVIYVEYDKQSSTFRIDFEQTASDTQAALGYVRRRLENIKPERISTLREDAQMQRKKGVPLEQAVADIRVLAEQYPNFGPTTEELYLYEQFYQKV